LSADLPVLFPELPHPVASNTPAIPARKDRNAIFFFGKEKDHGLFFPHFFAREC
jgi:hypothetical protein